MAAVLKEKNGFSFMIKGIQEEERKEEIGGNGTGKQSLLT